MPRFIKDEFDAFLACGHDKLLAVSCKRRGFCPSSGARLLSQAAAHLMDRVITHVRARQWVLSLPIPLRALLAAQPELVTPVPQAVQLALTRHLLDIAQLEADEDHGGAVSLIQRFWQVINVNLHLRCLQPTERRRSRCGHCRQRPSPSAPAQGRRC